MRGLIFGLLLMFAPMWAGAQDLSTQRDYSDPTQRDLPIACKAGDIEGFPGKTLGEVFGADWPAQPVPSSAESHSEVRLLERGPMKLPRGMDAQDSVNVVAVLVSADGTPLRAEILCSTRMGLNMAVRRHALSSTYAPAEVDGVAVTSVIARLVRFNAVERPSMGKPRRH